VTLLVIVIVIVSYDGNNGDESDKKISLSNMKNMYFFKTINQIHKTFFHAFENV